MDRSKDWELERKTKSGTTLCAASKACAMAIRPFAGLDLPSQGSQEG
jgi:hypothetical protein